MRSSTGMRRCTPCQLPSKRSVIDSSMITSAEFSTRMREKNSSIVIDRAWQKPAPAATSRSAPSTLAGSLVADPGMLTVAGFDPKAPGVWIKAATHRVNVLMPDSRQRELLSLLEAFLHLRLRPRYEG